MFKNRNSFNFFKQFGADSKHIFTKLTLSRQNFLMKSHTEFDENPSYDLVIDVTTTMRAGGYSGVVTTADLL